MNIILGFGAVEKAVQDEIMSAVHAAVAAGDSVDDVLAPWKQKAKEYDTLPRDKAPQRYTHPFWVEGAIRFIHTNRQHPASPDGCAALVVEIPFEPKEQS